MPTPTPNFAFLAHHDARLVALGTQAEEQFAIDPSVTLFKLRLFGEVLAKRAAARLGLCGDPMESQQALIDRLFDRNVIGATQIQRIEDWWNAHRSASNVFSTELADTLTRLMTTPTVGSRCDEGRGHPSGSPPAFALPRLPFV